MKSYIVKFKIIYNQHNYKNANEEKEIEAIEILHFRKQLITTKDIQIRLNRKYKKMEELHYIRITGIIPDSQK